MNLGMVRLTTGVDTVALLWCHCLYCLCHQTGQFRSLGPLNNVCRLHCRVGWLGIVCGIGFQFAANNILVLLSIISDLWSLLHPKFLDHWNLVHELLQSVLCVLYWLFSLQTWLSSWQSLLCWNSSWTLLPACQKPTNIDQYGMIASIGSV